MHPVGFITITFTSVVALSVILLFHKYFYIFLYIIHILKLYSTVPAIVKCVGCFQGNIYQDPPHLYNNSTNRRRYCCHLTSLALCQLCTEVTELVLCCITLFNSLIMVPCGPKHVAMLSYYNINIEGTILCILLVAVVFRLSIMDGMNSIKSII